MATNFTKEDFENYLAKNGLTTGNFSDTDLSYINAGDYDFGMGLASYKTQYGNAKTAEERARYNQGAEDLRSQRYGYTGGTGGNYYMPNQASPGDFKYSEAPSFSYDMENDPVYQSYAKQYAREGQRATENTLGAAAAATGGIASSYAATAAAQQGNYYAAQMSDKVPELYNAAYNRHLGDVSQYNTDRNFAYGQYVDEYNSQLSEKQQKWQDAYNAGQYGDYKWLNEMGVNTDNYMAERQWQQGLSETEFNQNMQKAQLALQAGDTATLKQIFGITTDTEALKFDREYNVAAAAANIGNYGPMNTLISKYF